MSGAEKLKEIRAQSRTGDKTPAIMMELISTLLSLSTWGRAARRGINKIITSVLGSITDTVGLSLLTPTCST